MDYPIGKFLWLSYCLYYLRWLTVAYKIVALRIQIWCFFRYWGWGGEDDDLFARLKGSGLNPQHLYGKSGTFRVRLTLT